VFGFRDKVSARPRSCTPHVSTDRPRQRSNGVARAVAEMEP
jgi:hypothetical protein